jgi:hypothetical protein
LSESTYTSCAASLQLFATLPPSRTGMGGTSVLSETSVGGMFASVTVAPSATTVGTKVGRAASQPVAARRRTSMERRMSALSPPPDAPVKATKFNPIP